MTLEELQHKIHLIYEGDTSYPSVGSEDWNLRTGLINAAIDVWAQENVRWRELFKNLSDATDGDKIALSTKTAYATPSDYRFVSSFVWIEDSNGQKTYYSFIRPDDKQKIDRLDPAGHYFYETGGAGSKKINLINPIDGTLNYCYYKTPTHLSSSTDVPEMINSDFIVWWVLAALYEQDLRNDKVTQYQTLAKQAMDYMIVENETRPFNQLTEEPDLLYEDGFILGQ